jgi:hypothetical protein
MLCRYHVFCGDLWVQEVQVTEPTMVGSALPPGTTLLQYSKLQCIQAAKTAGERPFRDASPVEPADSRVHRITGT